MVLDNSGDFFVLLGFVASQSLVLVNDTQGWMYLGNHVEQHRS